MGEQHLKLLSEFADDDVLVCFRDTSRHLPSGIMF